MNDIASTSDFGAAATISALRSRLEVLGKVRAAGGLGVLDGLRSRMAEMRLQAESLLGAVQAIPEIVALQAAELEAKVGESLGTAAGAFDAATMAINETLGSATEAAREIMTSQVSRVEEQAEEIVESAREWTEELLEETLAWVSDADEKAEELLLKAVPDDIEEEAEALQEGLKALEDTGIARVREFTDHLDEVTSKVDTLIQFVDAIKPVLEVTRQLS